MRVEVWVEEESLASVVPSQCRTASGSVFLTHLMSTLDSAILSNRLAAGAVGVVAILATTTYYALGSKDEGREFPKLRGIQLYHAWNFFQRRFDFLQSNFERNSGKSFSFNVLHHKLVAIPEA